MAAKLYVVPGSHPSMAARLMLERKGIPYKRVDLVSAMSHALLRPLRFPGGTVPALKLDDGRRVQGSRNISRELDRVQPEPRLFPEDAARRAAVEEAERWGDEELQSVPRRLSWWAIRHDMKSVRSFLEGPVMGLPPALAAGTARPIAWAAARMNNSNDDSVHADLTALPGLLDEVDRLVEEGVIGGEEPNAADYQILTSVRLLLCFDDLRPHIEERPSGRAARKLAPDYPGAVGPVFPAEWLTPLRAAVTA
jgi:glutathione S-transferase